VNQTNSNIWQADREFLNVNYEKCHIFTLNGLGSTAVAVLKLLQVCSCCRFAAVAVLPHLNEQAAASLPQENRFYF
jgi:hypothetical protein